MQLAAYGRGTLNRGGRNCRWDCYMESPNKGFEIDSPVLFHLSIKLYHMLVLLSSGEEFPRVQGEVANILKGRLLVGHAIMNDLKVCLHIFWCNYDNTQTAISQRTRCHERQIPS